MGLFSFFKKKELSPQEIAYGRELENFHREFKSRHRFQDGWHSVDLANNDIILSFNSLSGLKDFALSLNPSSPHVVKKNQPNSILIDVSLSFEKAPGECQKVVRELSRSLKFFQTEFEPSQVISENESDLPRLSGHAAGLAGFWLWLPLPSDAFKNVKAFDAVTAWCLEVAQKLIRLTP